MLNLFLHCTLFARGKCQEFIQACKLILNDCHLFAILLLSWEMCGDVWQKAQITVCNLTELLWETGAQSWLLVDCFCIIVIWTGLKYLDCCLMNLNFVKIFSGGGFRWRSGSIPGLSVYPSVLSRDGAWQLCRHCCLGWVREWETYCKAVCRAQWKLCRLFTLITQDGWMSTLCFSDLLTLSLGSEKDQSRGKAYFY